MEDAKKNPALINSHSGQSSKQQRALETRQNLVNAAREIFARDGFALATLEDIASAAGKTRGAFYAHFRDKEDVFFAIFEEDIRKDQEHIRPTLSAANSRQERVEVLARHLTRLLRDSARMMMLHLEFKVYAIRHPHRKKRLADLVTIMCTNWGDTGIDYLVPELRETNQMIRRAQTAHFGALVDGLALNHMFDPESLPEEQLFRLLYAGIEAIFDLQNICADAQECNQQLANETDSMPLSKVAINLEQTAT